MESEEWSSRGANKESHTRKLRYGRYSLRGTYMLLASSMCMVLFLCFDLISLTASES